MTSVIQKHLAQDLYYCLSKFENLFFQICSGQSACSILLGARRTSFLLLGSFQPDGRGGTTNIKKIVARYHPLWLRLLFEKQKDQTKVEKTEKV